MHNQTVAERQSLVSEKDKELIVVRKAQVRMYKYFVSFYFSSFFVYMIIIIFYYIRYFA